MNLVRREYELINVNFVDDVDGLNLRLDLFNIFLLPRQRIPFMNPFRGSEVRWSCFTSINEVGVGSVVPE